MAIQWFPGHMNSAKRKAAETMAKTDVVIEVLDARLPEASSNPMIHELRLHRNRSCLKVLNKSDLADPAATAAWLEFFNAQAGVHAIAISSKKAGETARLPRECLKLAPHRNSNLKPLRMMIMGIPNVGKSTLMNALLGRKVAAVGDEPAVTKNQQSKDLSAAMSITDTPGLLWPKIVHDSDGYMLAASHAVGVNAVLEEEVATFLAGILLERYPRGLVERYGCELEGLDAVGVVETVARKRNCTRKGRSGTSELDLEKASIILLTDYRAGALGRISLETPQTRQDMLARAARSRQPGSHETIDPDAASLDDV
jgi:ribosome biogenesis GTPase A